MKRYPIMSIRRFGRIALPILLAILTVAVGLSGFVWLSHEVTAGKTRVYDEWAILAFRSPDDLTQPIGPRWLTESARDVTSLGSATVLIAAIAVVSGYLALKSQWRLIVIMLTVGSTGFALSSILKGHYLRPRPNVVPHLMSTFNSSFPSGHSMMSAVVFLTLGTLLGELARDQSIRIYSLTIAIILTGLVGLSRVFLGVHYPSDVLAGWTAGVIWATSCRLIERLLQRHGEIAPSSTSSTP